MNRELGDPRLCAYAAPRHLAHPLGTMLAGLLSRLTHTDSLYMSRVGIGLINVVRFANTALS